MLRTWTSRVSSLPRHTSIRTYRPPDHIEIPRWLEPKDKIKLMKPKPKYQQPENHPTSKDLKEYASKIGQYPPYVTYTQAQKDWFWENSLDQYPYDPQQMSAGLTEHQGAVWPRDAPELAPKMKNPEGHRDFVDPDSEPFRQVYAANEDKNDDGSFSKAEVVSDPNVWFWVQRVLPKKELPELPTSDDRRRLPSGWIPLPKTPPKKDYFVKRTRGGLFPVYKVLHRREMPRIFRLDEPVPDEAPDVYTQISHVYGRIRQMEKDIHNFIMSRHPEKFQKKKLLSAVNEIRSTISIKGDHVQDVVAFLESTGF